MQLERIVEPSPLAAESRERVQETARRWLLIAASTTAIIGLLHLGDHILRGKQYVLPLVGAVDTIWLAAATYLFVLLPLYLTARGRLLTGYWLFAGMVASLLVGFGHLSPFAFESVHTIYMDHANDPPVAALSLTLLYSLFASSLALIVAAVRVRRLTGSWR